MDGHDLTCTVAYDNGYTNTVTYSDSTYSSGSYGLGLYYGTEIDDQCEEYYFKDFTITDLSDGSALAPAGDDAAADQSQDQSPDDGSSDPTDGSSDPTDGSSDPTDGSDP